MTLEMMLGEKLEIFRKVQANPDISTYKWTRICAYDKDSNNNDSMTTQDLDLTEGVTNYILRESIKDIQNFQ